MLGTRSSYPGALKNVQQVAKLEHDLLAHRSASERLAAFITSVAGTAAFAILHLVWFTGWIALNLGLVTTVKPFDPFPFGLLTTIVSLEAIFLSIWILITQNHMARRADRRAQLDLQVNLLAEQESTATLNIVRQIAAHLGMTLPTHHTDRALTTETDVETLAAVMDEALPEGSNGGRPQPPAPRRS